MPEIIGKVTSVNVNGDGQNSAQLLFTVKETPFVVLSYPAYEPQVYAAMAALVSAAYFAEADIKVKYKKVTGETNRAIQIEIPGRVS